MNGLIGRTWKVVDADENAKKWRLANDMKIAFVDIGGNIRCQVSDDWPEADLWRNTFEGSWGGTRCDGTPPSQQDGKKIRVEASVMMSKHDNKLAESSQHDECEQHCVTITASGFSNDRISRLDFKLQPHGQMGLHEGVWHGED